jgi:hypothetical protein
MGLSLAFTWAARKATPADSGPPRAAAEHLDPAWRRVLPRRLDELTQAWREPEAWEGMTEAGGVTMPAQVTGRGFPDLPQAPSPRIQALAPTLQDRVGGSACG